MRALLLLCCFLATLPAAGSKPTVSTGQIILNKLADCQTTEGDIAVHDAEGAIVPEQAEADLAEYTALFVLNATGNGYDHRTPNRLRKRLQAAIGWLQVRLENGTLEHAPRVRALCALALIESYAMTMDRHLRPLCEQLAERIAREQSAGGAWFVEDSVQPEPLLSCYSIMALKSAVAGGLGRPGNWHAMRRWSEALVADPATPEDAQRSAIALTCAALTGMKHAPIINDLMATDRPDLAAWAAALDSETRWLSTLGTFQFADGDQWRSWSGHVQHPLHSRYDGRPPTTREALLDTAYDGLTIAIYHHRARVIRRP